MTEEIITHGTRQSAIRIWTLRVLALLGLLVTCYIAAQSARGTSLAGCEPGSGCSHVLSSRWSIWLGHVPVAPLAAGVYMAYLAASLGIAPSRSIKAQRTAWWLMIVLSLVIFGAAAWFITLQVYVIRAFCVWCMSAHWIGVALTVLTLLLAPIGRPRFAGDSSCRVGGGSVVFAAVLALLLVGGLATGQVLVTPATHRVLRFQNLGIPTENYPVIGSRSAPHLLICFFDYTCPHCRALHGYLQAARARYPGQLAIALAPVPLSAQCNKTINETEPFHVEACAYAKLMLAVYRLAPSHLEEFDTFLMQGDRPPTVAAARQRAEQWIDRSTLDAELAQPWLSQMIDAQIELNNRLRRSATERGQKLRGGLPTMILSNDRMIAGRPATAEEFFQVLEEELKLKTPSTQPLSR
ncbi:MAG: thioredoxin domain-containing protein [Phycisphaeraceae bacterium]|nr:thioredoxin domain-containing protein [Phycisphaeraceae bacterium]